SFRVFSRRQFRHFYMSAQFLERVRFPAAPPKLQVSGHFRIVSPHQDVGVSASPAARRLTPSLSTSGAALNDRRRRGVVNGVAWAPCHFTQGMSSAAMRVRLAGVGSRMPVPVAGTVVTGAAAVVAGDADV